MLKASLGLGLGGGLAAGQLSGCSGVRGREDVAGDGFPRTVEHAGGQTTIPARPRRVVSATDNIDLDGVLAVGLVPVAFGHSDWLVPDLTPWAMAADGGKRLEGPIADVDLERIAAQRPDLVVVEADVIDARKLALLQKVAPTVSLPVPHGSWQVGTEIVGRATGREERAAQTISRTRRSIAAARAGLSDLHGARVAMIGAQGEQVRVASSPPGRASSSTGGGPLLTALGQRPVDAGVDPRTRLLSYEELDRLDDADVMLVQDYGAGTDELIAAPTFRRLSAVADGRVVRLSPACTRACDLLSSLSAPYAARELARALLSAHRHNGSRGGHGEGVTARSG